MRRALITGGSGFLGPHLARALRDRGWSVRLFDVAPFPADEERAGEFLLGDVNDARAMAAACAGVDTIFHLAALVPLCRSGPEFHRVNAEGTRSALEAARLAGARKAIVLSSSSVFGRPSGPPLTEASPLAPLDAYGRSKAAAEAICGEIRHKGLDVTVIRPRTLVGEGRLGILHLLFDWVSLGKRFYILGPGENRFQLLSARDCAQACVLAAETPCRNQDFNVGAERYGTLRDDLETLCRHAGTGSRIVSLPAGPAKAVLSVLDAARLSPLAAWHYGSLDAEWRFDVSKARDALGWSARDSNVDMLVSAYDWFVANRTRVTRTAAGSSPHRRPVVESLLGALKRFS